MSDHCEICGGELSPDDHHTSEYGNGGYAHDDCIEDAWGSEYVPGVGIPDLLAGLELGSISELSDRLALLKTLEEQLPVAHAGLLRALDYRAATPEGLAIRADVRDALNRSGFTGPMGEMGGS